MKIHASFEAKLEKNDTENAWTFVIWSESSTFFGTKGSVKVKGTIDGQPFQSSFMPMGGGVQMLPVKAETRKLIGKDVGDTVQVVLEEKVES